VSSARRSSVALPDVLRFYESDVVIDAFNRGFAGRWHTAVSPDIPGIADSVEYVCHLGRLRKEHHVLDFGSGVGATSCDLAHLTGCRVSGLNISQKQVRLATQHAGEVGLGSRVVFDCYAGRQFPYRSRTFDRATFFESPCHVPHKTLLFTEIFRTLKAGGACVGQDWMLAIDDFSEQDYEQYIRPIEVSCEVSLRSLLGYRALMEAAGFVNVRVIDARDLDPALESSFARPSDERIRVQRGDGFASRLRLGNLALSNAFHRGLFTIGFVYGEKPAASPPRRRQAETPAARPPNGAASVPPATRHVHGTDYTPAMFAPEKNLAWVEFHRNAFSIPLAEPLAAFARLVAGAQGCTVEPSCKVEGGVVHPARFNLFYHGHHKAHFLNKMLAFFDEAAQAAGVCLDTRPLEDLLRDGIDLQGVRKVVTGIDVRPERGRSRLKIWFIVNSAQECLKRIAVDDVDWATFRTLHIHDELLVGYDLRFDGTTAIKVYPDVRPQELRIPETRQRLAAVLSEPALDAMACCSWTHLYLAKHNPDIVLQFHPSDADEFVHRYVNCRRARKIHEIYRGRHLLDMVVSMQDNKLQRGNVDNYALYYMPAHRPPAESAVVR
jgi:LynF/TruF/PatF family peptide O-prenyltransferase